MEEIHAEMKRKLDDDEPEADLSGGGDKRTKSDNSNQDVTHEEAMKNEDIGKAAGSQDTTPKSKCASTLLCYGLWDC